MNKNLRILLSCLLAFMFLLGVAYTYMDKETKVLNVENRAELGGQYVQLEKGVVHYEMKGDKSLDTVVLVHGFSSPLYVFDPTFDYLLANNFRVLRFDLFGRGYSDRIDSSDYSIALYVDQLHDLLRELKIAEPINLLGLSMGGAVVTHFTNQYPAKVKKLTLVSPLFHTPSRPEVALVKTPGLGEFLGKVVLIPKFINGASETVFDTASFPDWTEKFSTQTQYKGFSYALVQTARFLSGKSFKSEYEKLGASGKPVQLFWGQQDTVLPFEDSERVRMAVPNIEFHPLDRAGHLPHYEHPEKVNPLILSFLTEK